MIEYLEKDYAINLLEYNAKVYHYRDIDKENIVRDTIERLCLVLREAPAADVQPVNQWISVDDKLPEWDKTVLVWYASDTLFGVSEGYGLSWYHGSWRLNELNGENIRIFYWQYLPEKPKEG